jgi:hypothetical protein
MKNWKKNGRRRSLLNLGYFFRETNKSHREQLFPSKGNILKKIVEALR